MKYFFANTNIIFLQLALLLNLKNTQTLSNPESLKLSSLSLYLKIIPISLNTPKMKASLKIKLQEILKTFRFELKNALNSVLNPQLQKTDFSKQISKFLKFLQSTILKSFKISFPDFEHLLLESNDKALKSLYETLQNDIRLLYEGIFPDIPIEAPKYFSKESLFYFLQQLYSASLFVLHSSINDLIIAKEKVSLESDRFALVQNQIEKDAENIKFLLYKKFGLSDQQAPACIILQSLIERISETDPDFSQTIINLEEDFKANSEILLSLIKL